MPKYQYKAEEFNGQLDGELPAPRKPTIFLPVSQEQAKGAEVGKEVSVTLTGIVRGVNSQEGRTANLDIELVESDVYSTDVAPTPAEEGVPDEATLAAFDDYAE